jgi:hypothetical protein
MLTRERLMKMPRKGDAYINMRIVLLIVLSLLLLTGCGAQESKPTGLCENPAPVLGEYDPDAPGYMVLFHDGIDAEEETNRLATLYGFQPTYILENSPVFAATFSTDVLEHLRCEPSIKSITHDSVMVAL